MRVDKNIINSLMYASISSNIENIQFLLEKKHLETWEHLPDVSQKAAGLLNGLLEHLVRLKSKGLHSHDQDEYNLMIFNSCCAVK